MRAAAHLPRLDRLDDAAPHARLLSNGSYTVLISSAGTGLSTWGDTALTAWSGDRTEDGDGVFLYIRDLDDGRFWSATVQPVTAGFDSHGAAYADGCMRLSRTQCGVETQVDIAVAPHAPLEVRRLRLRNLGDRPRRLEVTTYAEVVLQQRAAHAAHPAFSKLFVETFFEPASELLLASRRPRSDGEPRRWMAQALLGPGSAQWESDRGRFLGRGRTPTDPLALSGDLSGSSGRVLDPVLAMRRRVSLAAGEAAELAAIIAAGDSRSGVRAAIAPLRSDPAGVGATFAAAAAAEGAVRSRLQLDERDAAYLQELAGAMLYGRAALRAAVRARRAPGTLDRSIYGLRSEALLVLAEIGAADAETLVPEIAAARAYWGARGVRIELIVLCDDPGLAATRLQACWQSVAEILPGATPGNIAVHGAAEVGAEARAKMRAAADLAIRHSFPILREPRRNRARGGQASGVPLSSAAAGGVSPQARPREDLLFDNGHGGFTADGREYVIHLDPRAPGGSRPPMPWINVVANEQFGSLLSESGARYTWSGNSRENRLTPWYNDPVSDPYGEALYLRDEESGALWSPLPGPSSAATAAEVRHGFGYSKWRQRCSDLDQEVTIFVPRADPLQIVHLHLTNLGEGPRRLSAFSYHRLVLGPQQSQSVRTEIDSEALLLLAVNPMNGAFSDRVAFAAAALSEGARCFLSGDRASFIGRNRRPANAALPSSGADLDGRSGADLDPCAALQVKLELLPAASVDVFFLFGQTESAAAARTLVERYRRPGVAAEALAGVRRFWQETLSAISVETPVRSLDLMLNGWLLYQALACRLWARSAFYQSGGAFGFRDQLQDSAALVYARPALMRAQIALHAAHQFTEGDVLHWWHPPDDRGTRTRFADDLLWMPYLAAFYARSTGDWGIFDETAAYVSARRLEPGEDEAYLRSSPSTETSDIYEHCCRAIDRSLALGAHGLPLMGTGDWNDGMNRVGREGRGESVWMAFFLHDVLVQFEPVCERRGDDQRLRRYRQHRLRLQAAIDGSAWDGRWYRRAYYDDGTPLGSAENDECRIDALAQAWAVISGTAPADRARTALDAVEELLVSEEAGIIRLLTPPFDTTAHDPGYIKGYLPGIRENGGQYTHAAVWVVRAMAEIGRRDRAAELLERLGPVWHGRSRAAVAAYQVEPYVVAADIYGLAPHLGRGGWTWYTGSAAWMYRVALESILGLTLEEGRALRLRPRFPDSWPRARLSYTLPEQTTRYEIELLNPSGNAGDVRSATIDGEPAEIAAGVAIVPFRSDGQVHRVTVVLG